jgi:hypothetical protein
MNSLKFETFIKELEQLCRRHQVCLSTSYYDGLQVWDLRDSEREVIHCAGIEDRCAGGEIE